MTIKEFKKLCKEHNAMDYAMVIANSRRQIGYPLAVGRLRVNSDYEEIRARFDLSDKEEHWTTDCATVEEFFKWAGSFKNYEIVLEDYNRKYNYSCSTTFVGKSDVKFVPEDEMVILFFI